MIAPVVRQVRTGAVCFWGVLVFLREGKVCRDSSIRACRKNPRPSTQSSCYSQDGSSRGADMTHNPIRPLKLSLNIDRHIEAAFEELIHARWGRDLTGSFWQPAVDMHEADDAYLIEVDLPGVAPERVKIEAQGHRLTIRGARESLTTGISQSGRSVLLERRHGELFRTIDFDQPVEAAHIEVQFDQGIVQIRVPKLKGFKPERKP